MKRIHALTDKNELLRIARAVASADRALREIRAPIPERVAELRALWEKRAA